MTKLTPARILFKSLRHRSARSLSALLALTVSAAVATTLLTLYTDLNSKLHSEFRRFGANIVIEGTAAISPDTLDAILHIAGPDSIAAPFGYAVATTDRGTSVVVAGTDFTAAKQLNGSWWQVDQWPQSGALLGSKAAQFVGDAQQLTLTYSGKTLTFPRASKLSTGGEEDSHIYLSLKDFESLTGQRPTIIQLQIPGSASRIQTVIDNLHRSFPQYQVRPVRQLVEGESRIVDRTNALMYASVILIALTVAMSVLSTLSAAILDRRRDFALMKVLGSSQSQLVTLFLSETLLLSVAAVCIGYVVGIGGAWLISQWNWHTATLPRISVLPVVFLINIAIATLAALLPTRSLRALEPAAVLRGE